MSELFKLNTKDFVKGLAVAVIVVILGALQQAFETSGLDVTAFDWAGILDVAWKAAVAYIGKNLLTDKNDKILGAI